MPMKSVNIEDPGSDWSSIFAVIVGISAFGISLGLTYPLISLILAAQGYGEGLIGFNASVAAMGIGVSTLLLPWVTDRIPADRLVILGLAMSAITIGSFAIFPSLVAWFFLRFMLGFSINLVFVLSEAWLATACTDQLRGRVTAGYTASLNTGFALGPLGIPLFGTDQGLGFAAGAALVAFVTMTFVVLTRGAKVRPEAAPHGSMGKFARKAPLLIVMVAAFAFVDAAAISLFPIYFLEKGLSEGMSATTVTVIFLGVLGTMPIIGIALDRYHRPFVAMTCSLTAAFAVILLPFLEVTSFLMWAVIFLLGGAFSGIFTCALTALGEGFKGGLLVAGSAVFSLTYAISAIIGPPLTGIIMETTGELETLPIFFCIVFLLLAAIIRLANWKSK